MKRSGSHGSPGKGLAALAAALAALGAGLAAGDEADGPGDRWSKPQTVFGPKQAVLHAEAAAGPGRYAVLVWGRGEIRAVPAAAASGPASRPRAHRVFASVRRPGGRRFGPARPLSPPGVWDYDMAMAPDGQTIVTWVDDGRLRAVFRGPRQGWGEPRTVARGVRFSAGLEIGSDGSAIAAWSSGSGSEEEIIAALRPAGGGFGPPQTVPVGPEFGFELGTDLEFAAGRGGRGVVVWEGVCPLAAPELREPARASFVQPDGTFGPPEEIRRSRCPDAGLELAMDDRGGAALIVNGSLHDWGGIRAALRPPGGSFAPAELISGRGRYADFAELGISGDGRAVAVWTIYEGGPPWGAEASIRPPGGEFGPPVRITGRDHTGGPGRGDLAVNRRGHAVVAWQSLRGGWPLKAAYMRPGGRFGDPERVSGPLSRRAGTKSVAAVSPSGRALVAWQPPGAGNPNRGVFVAARRLRRSCQDIGPTIEGTPGDDRLRGTAGADVIRAGAGDDAIDGRGGRDVICAGPGDDRVRGGAGEDDIRGRAGADELRGGAGRDRCAGGQGRDKLTGCER